MEDSKGEYERDARAQVHKARHGGAEAILALKDAGESGEEEVHGAEHEGYVDGDDEQDGRLDQELAGSDQRRNEHMARCQALGDHLVSQVHVPSAGPEARRLAIQQDLGVRLAHKDGGGDEDGATYDDEKPECPSPTKAYDGKASDKWSEYLRYMSVHARKRYCEGIMSLRITHGSSQRAQTEKSHSHRPGVDLKKIRNGGTTQGHRDTAHATRDEAEHHELCHCLA